MFLIKNNENSNSFKVDSNRKRKVLSEMTNLDENTQDEPIIVSSIQKKDIQKQFANSIQAIILQLILPKLYLEQKIMR